MHINEDLENLFGNALVVRRVPPQMGHVKIEACHQTKRDASDVRQSLARKVERGKDRRYDLACQW